jgi:pimeloyl-ACP methyl ester carboxylesterase
MSDEFTGRYVEINGTRTYYETAGELDAPPVVLIHTAGAEGRQWRYVAPALVNRGYHVVVPDLPGHGKSYPVDWDPYTSIHQHAEFVWRLIETLDLKGPTVAGCSIGGDTALDLAVHHADDLQAAVVLEGAGRTRGAPLGRLSHPHAAPGWQSILDYSVVDSTGTDCSDTRKTELVWQHHGAQEVATNDLQGWADFDVMDDLNRVTCPVLLVRGDADFYIQDDVFETTAERLPDCKAVTLNDVGHYPMMETPTKTTERIADFLNEQL